MTSSNKKTTNHGFAPVIHINGKKVRPYQGAIPKEHWNYVWDLKCSGNSILNIVRLLESERGIKTQNRSVSQLLKWVAVERKEGIGDTFVENVSKGVDADFVRLENLAVFVENMLKDASNSKQQALAVTDRMLKILQFKLTIASDTKNDRKAPDDLSDADREAMVSQLVRRLNLKTS